MKYDALIVGAGLAGATAARILAESGKKVLVVEKRRHIGGNCYDFRNEAGITTHKYGPHIFHTNNQMVWNFLNRFTEFNYFQHKVVSYVDGKLIPFPINRDTLVEVYGTVIDTNQVREFLAAEVAKAVYNNPPQNFRDAVVSQVGERLYELFFKNYTIKQWERDPQELSAEIAQRIPIRENRDSRYFSDKYQGIPSQGYTKMVENMLEHPNIAVLLGEDYFAIQKDLTAKVTIFTGLLDSFFAFKHGKLEYRSIDIRFKTIDCEQYQAAAVVNYPNDYDWTRITEFKYFLDEKSDKTTICFEHPLKEGEPYYVVLTDDNMQRRAQYMEEVRKLEESGDYLFIGRLAEYKYYNMDQVVNAAMLKVNEWEKRYGLCHA